MSKDSELEEMLRRIAGKIEHGGSYTASVTHAIIKPAFQQNIARRSRADALGKVIMEIVRKNPQCTVEELKDALLRDEEHQGAIASVTETNIEWTNRNGCVKDTSIAALKDRLSRAKKKILSR
ncbi:MAG: hypothetical protein ABFS02_09825 [Pseudomonadota bacterium]